MAEALAMDMEAFGELVFALMLYTRDGELSGGLREGIAPIFAIYRAKIDAARKKYNATCEARAQSGAKGGKAKAANAAKAQQLPPDPAPDAPFKPPNKAEFRAIIKKLQDRGEPIRTVSAKEINSFWSNMDTSDWCFRGERFRTNQELETMLIYRYFDSNTMPFTLAGAIFSTIFADFHGVRNGSDVSKAENAFNNFCECYDTDTDMWNVNNTQYSEENWRDALADFMTTYKP